MKHYLKSTAAALALALLVSCSSSPAPENTGVPESAGASESAAPAPAETGTAEDMAMLTAGLRRDSELFSADGQPVTAEEYLFWLANAISIQKQMGNLANDAAWEETLNGSDTATTLKNDALSTALFYRVIQTKAAEQGITLSAEDEAEVDAQVAADEEHAGGEAAFQLWLNAHCISREAYRRIYETYALEDRLRDALKDMDAFLEERGIYAAKHILLLTRRMAGNGEEAQYEEYSDSEKADTLKRITEMREEILASSDTEDKFDELMNKYSEDERNEKGILFYPDGYTYVYPGQMTEEFEEAAKALKIGEVSEPVKTEYGYHLILRIAPDNARARTERQTALTEEWTHAAGMSFTKAYEELDPKAFYERLTEAVGTEAPNPTPAG